MPESLPKWLISSLAEDQISAAKRTTKHANILAGAGSGKTRTLVHLLANELLSGIKPSEIIAFTFTEKAADELLTRIYSLVGQHLPNLDLSGIYIGTIHAWCFKYLLGQSKFTNFDAIDELQLDALVSRLYDQLGLDRFYGVSYPKAIDEFQNDLDLFYNELLPVEQIPDQIRIPLTQFLKVLDENRLITFGGMIYHASDHLVENGPVVGLKRLYVDEYQDVNPSQVEVIKRMISPDTQVIAVGDDLQCIYQWRGSDVNRILNFESDFTDSSTFRLQKNYRSRPPIVELANSISDNLQLRDVKKRMTPERGPSFQSNVSWLSLDGEDRQAEEIADVIERFASNKVAWNSMAILIRSVIGSGPPIIAALERRGIPVNCPILSRGGGFVDTFLIPIFDWLRVDRSNFRNKEEEAKEERASENLWATVSRWTGNDANVEEKFWQALNQWADLITSRDNIAYDVRGRLYDFLNECGVRASIRDRGLMVGLGIGSQIIRSVEEIHRRRISGEVRRTPRRIITEIYYALLRNKKAYGESLPIESSADEGVLITTVHQAKGLEWPIVIIPSLVNRRFPVKESSHGTSYPDEIAQRYGTSVDDERRLFYVAVTRARDRLLLMDSAQHNSEQQSVFLKELESEGKITARTTCAGLDKEFWELDQSDMRRPEPSPVRVSLSDILLNVECPFQYGLRRNVGIQPSVGDELGYGKGLHELIRKRLENAQPWSAKDLLKHTQNNVHLPYMSKEAEGHSRESIMERVSALENAGVFTVPSDPEVVVDVAFKQGVVSGVIDGIENLESGKVRIRDWKTNIHEALLPRYEKQLQFYAIALERRGKDVTEADLVDVGKSFKNKKLIATTVDVSSQKRKSLTSELEASLESIARGEFIATPSHTTCAVCDMSRLCAERWVN